MGQLDANLLTVQWGVLGVFGVVVTLLIPHADQYYKGFLTSGTDYDQREADGWAKRIRHTAGFVLGALIVLYGLGTCGSSLSWMAHVLLLVPLLAQLGFIILVFGLVRRVRALVLLPLRPATLPRLSQGGHSKATIIRFENDSQTHVSVYWIDFNGKERGLGPDGGPLVIPPGRKLVQPTFMRHVFLLKNNDKAFHVVAAAAGKAVIDGDEGHAELLP